jgi:hypothetical protein
MPAIIKIIVATFLFPIMSCTDNQPHKDHGLRRISQSQLTYKGVVDRIIELKFKVKKSKNSVLRTLITVPYDSDKPHRYTWTLGPGLSVVQGELSADIILKKGQTHILEITVSGFDADQKRFVRFEVMGENSRRTTFADGVISSDQMNSFEEIVKEVEAFKKESAK